MTGIVEVISFDEEKIMLNTKLGPLTIKGLGLKMNKLDVQNGDVIIVGEISAMIYSSKEIKKEKESIRDKIRYYADEGWISTPVQWDEDLFQFYLNFCQNENIDAHLRNMTKEYEAEKNSEKNKFCKKIAKCKTKKYLQKIF